MESIEVVELFSNIDAAIEQGEATRALRLIVANFDALSDPAPLRERTAEAFAVEDDIEGAIDIYERVGNHYLNAGHPARVLAAVKKIEDAGGSAEDLRDRFATLYNVRSPFLDSSRRHASFGPPEGEVVVDAEDVDISPDDLHEEARDQALEQGPFVEEPPDDLPPLPVLSQLPSDTLDRIVDELTFESPDDLTQVSGPGISEGQLLWTVSPDLTIGDDDPTYRIRPGSLLGLHRLAQSPLAGNEEVYARSGSEILVLPQEETEALAGELEEFREALSTVARQSFIEGLLESHGMFEVLPKEEREGLLSQFIGLELDEGTRLIDQGTESPGLFVLIDGEVDVVRQDEDWEITVRTLGAGDVFGEIGLVSDRETQANVVMTEPGHVLHMPALVFDEVAGDHPELAKWAVGLAQERREELESTLSAQDLAEISE